MTQLLTQLLLVLGAAQITGQVFRKIGQPRVVGEMVAGIALGPSLLGIVAPGTLTLLFSSDQLGALNTLSQLGVILFMFAVGLRLDTIGLRPRLATAVAVSHASITVPFVFGSALGVYLHPYFAPPGVAVLPFVLFLGAAMSVTAFPVLARILGDGGLLKTPIGSVALACAAVDDVTAWCLLAAVISITRADSATLPLTVTVLGTLGYAAVIVTLVRRGLRRWVERRFVGGHSDVDASVLPMAVMAALTSALATEWLGIHAVIGAFLIGTVVPRRHGLADAIAHRLEGPVGALFLPVFFAFTGLRTDLRLLQSGDLWGVFAGVLLVAVIGKLAGSAVAARFTGLSWREATSVGVLMNTRGLMELVVLNVGLDLGVMSPSLFSMMVLMAVVTTVMTTPVLSMVLPPGQTIAERTDTGASGSRSVFVPSHEVHGQPSESEGAAEATG